jgi:response regulator NasT
MDLFLVSDSQENSQPLLRAVSKAGYRVLKLIGPEDGADRYVESLRPDAILIVSDRVCETVLHVVDSITRIRPTPMLVFTRDSRQDTIDSAVKAGVTTYVIDCDAPERLVPLLNVTRARFKEQKALRRELAETKKALHERKRVEKAKGIIMKSKSLSEDQAYNAMRKLAMNHNKRIGEIAEQIISASEVLV